MSVVASGPMNGDAIAAELPAFAKALEQHDAVAPFNEQTQLNSHQRTAFTGRNDQGDLIALALAHRIDDETTEAELAVHPSVRGQGIGRTIAEQLLSWTQGTLQVWAHGDLEPAHALAEALDAHPDRVLYVLSLPLADELVAPEVPAGWHIRGFDQRQDADAWVSLNAEVFADHPEQGQLTRTDLDARLQQPWFNADDFLVLIDAEGRMRGYCWCKIDADEYEIYVVGVAPSAASKGLGTALMNAGLRRLRERGADEAVLYVDGSNERAVALYRRLGFVTRNVDVQYVTDGHYSSTSSPIN